MPPPNEGTPAQKTDAFGPSPFDGKAPASITAQLDRKIESIPHEQVQAHYDAAVKELEENKAAPGKALKSVFGMLIGLVKPT